MDCAWKLITVSYGGAWHDCMYVGGTENVVRIPVQPLSLYNLIYNINHLLQSNELSTNYQLYYLSNSRPGKIIKSLLSDDHTLDQLCIIEAFPKVYVTHNHTEDGFGVSHQEAYIPSFDSSDDYSFDLNQSLPVPLTDEMEHFWSMNTSNWCDRSHTRSCDREASYEEAPIESDADDVETDTDASYNATDNSTINFTFADFEAWIRKEGGITTFLSLLNPSNDRNVSIPDGSTKLNNWLLPMIPLDTTESLVSRNLDPTIEEELCKGSYYYRKDDLEIAVGLWHMVRGVDFIVPRSDTKRVVYKCKHSQMCQFELRASHHGEVWGVYKFVDDHSCQGDLDQIPEIKVKADVVAAYFARKMRRDCKIIKPREIMAELQREFGVHISYDVALRGRNNGIELIYGKHDESFRMLPGYLHMLMQKNPGTLTDLDIDQDGRFQHLFVALGASRVVYNSCLRPVIVVDGTHLKGRNTGILFVAMTIDANEQLYPLAYGVGPIENDHSRTWFLERVYMAYGCSRNTLIISDAHISIANAVRQVYPNAHHALCYYHILNKLQTYGIAITDLYKRAAYVYRVEHYEKAMGTIRSIAPRAYDYLMHIGPDKWARAMCPVRRYSVMTSNPAESFNNVLKSARRLPICAMIEAIRHIIEKWLHERRAEAENKNDRLSEVAIKKITEEIKKSRRYDVQRITEMKFRVQDEQRNCMVDLNQRTCECREFDLDGMPCSHAIAAIQNKGHVIPQYVDNCYTRATLIESYSMPISPPPHRDQWVLPDDVRHVVVLPPVERRQAGRPSLSRRRSATERGSRRVTTTQESSSSRTRRRAPKKCSQCRQEGHTKPNCPDMQMREYYDL